MDAAHPTAALSWQRRGTSPVGQAIHLPGVVWGSWWGWGCTARLAPCWGGSNCSRPGVFLVQGFIHPKLNSLAAGMLDANVVTQAVVETPAPVPPVVPSPP